MFRIICFLLLTALTAQTYAGTTWKIWVDPTAKICSNTASTQTPTFWTKPDIEAAIEEANRRLEKVCNLTLEVTQYPGQATFKLVSRNADTSRYMYMGSPNAFAAAVYDHPTIIINDGWIPARYNTSGKAFWYPFTDGNRNGLSMLILHEIGHHPSIWPSPVHTYDLGRVFHNQSPTLAEVRIMQQKFGKPTEDLLTDAGFDVDANDQAIWKFYMPKGGNLEYYYYGARQWVYKYPADPKLYRFPLDLRQKGTYQLELRIGSDSIKRTHTTR